jgi:hypothetical protein
VYEALSQGKTEDEKLDSISDGPLADRTSCGTRVGLVSVPGV